MLAVTTLRRPARAAVPSTQSTSRRTPPRRVQGAAATVLLVIVTTLWGCGYRVVGSVGKLPDGIKSIAVPTFDNRSPQFRIEQRITLAVVRELNTRTRIPVVSSPSGVDAILVGEIRSVSSSPVTFGGDTFGSAFLVTVQMSVKLVRTRDSAVIWQNGDFLFRERYTLNPKVQDFFAEEGPALDRLSREFAASLISTLLSRGNP
jgi:Lipopolysaccharide-assembly